jgi:FKBP-type peptidyl-prolyl cis-trans isomerase FklB
MLMLAMIVLPAIACAQNAPALKTERDKLSYAMGMDLGIELKTRTVDIDPALLSRGLTDALSGGETLLTASEAKEILARLQQAIVARRASEEKAARAENAAAGGAFLAANKAKEGVVTLPSGVQYKVLAAGTGKKPSVGDTVVCQYRGTLVDGKEFDSTYKRGQPATFPVKAAIKGWVEVLQLMPVGSKWQVVVPPALAYGERGSGPDIGPNATLVFEIELVGIK